MLFNSLSFLIFFPIVTLVYFVLPHKVRYIWLLIASYFFYMSWNAKYGLLLFGCTLITYLSGIFIGMSRRETEQGVSADKRRVGSQKFYVVVSFLLNLGLLAYFKYANFALDSLRGALGLFGVSLNVPAFDIVLPVGISFFIFQALGYTIDVYRGNIKEEKNFFKYAVFVSFFPQLVAGPIERSGNLLRQFDEKHRFEPDRVVRGLMMMLWGYFQKLVIADRVAVIVNQIFNYYTYYSGFEIAVGAVLFAVQVYCDFAGYTNIAIGASQVLGFDLMQNFKQPYLAHSVADFWRRWHISLTSWFRDYLYFPLGGSRVGKLKKYRNIMIVFLVSGLWHGALWTFVIWGALNGLFQVVGEVTSPLRKRALGALHVKTDSFGHRLAQTLTTFVLVDFTWIFFRANSVGDAFDIIGRLFGSFNPWVLFDGTLFSLGLSQTDFWVTVCAIAVLLVVDILHERGVRLRELIARQNIALRYVLYYAALFAVLIFGSYGPSYDAASFIYFQF